MIYLLFLLLFASTSIAWIYKNRFGNSPVRYLPYYLLFLCIEEIGAAIIRASPIKYNIWWYNIMLNMHFYFFIYFFYNYIENKIVKKMLLVLTLIATLYFIINYSLFSESWQTPQSFPELFYNVVIVFSAFWYLMEVFQSDQALMFHKNFMFWLTVGILFYSIVSIPYKLILYYIAKVEYIDNLVIKSFSIGMIISNIVLHFLIIYGILWILKPQKL